MARDTERGAGPENGGRAAKVLPVADDPARDDRGGRRRTEDQQRNIYAEWRPRSEREEEIVDAEIVDETGPQGPGENWERLRDRAREFFGAKTKAWMDDRSRRRSADEERAAADGDGLDERELLLKLRAETRLAGEKYMQSLRDSKLLVPGFSDDQARGREFDVMHSVYMQMMLQSCLRPLTRGVNSSSVIQAVGMMVAMRMLSPDFREEMGSYLQPLNDKIRERIDARTRSVRSFAQDQADRRNRVVEMGTAARLKRNPGLADDETFLAGRESRKTDRTSFVSRKWQRRMEDLEHRERGHREMFTPQSAAMTEVALMENAFWRMRDPQNDSNEIYASYRAMRKRLRDQIREDGLDRQDVVTCARMIIGERMESEPELRLMFNGMAQGRVVKAPPHAEQIAGTDRVRMTWTGEFDDHLGVRIPDSGMFTLRRPMDADTHQAQLGETMAKSMLDAIERGDQEAYADSVIGYLVGFAASKQGLDTSLLSEVLQQRMDQSEVMLASMDIDGLSPEKQREVYSNAVTDAMEEVGRQHPGVEQYLKQAFGTDWQATLQNAVNDPARFVREQQARPTVYQAGPGQPPQQGAGFDWGWSSSQAGPDSDEYQPA
ncbi:hypothetical protein [Streptomyces sp. NPDC052042]|uniref:hypothetical protein n=1 Tax=Streptomyces sp. NPDC052042 TaxID=3365683 RepID=UPI0037CF6FB6